ncbi:MAG: hypothetical protein JO247_19730 [Chloroflexi bacterium]|nr:hypothetical protein [Chloroflexota bacterium]
MPLANKPKPDFASQGALYEDGYSNYPANPARSITEAPGLGSTVTAFVQPLDPPGTPFDQNPAWKQMDKELNATFQFNLAPVADFQAKFATLMAGGDLPDLINVFRGIRGVPNLPPFMQSQCADLSPYLGGDAIKDYPNLAAIPTFAWRNSGSVLNGRPYMVPIERAAPGSFLLKNAPAYDQEIGANYVPKNADDFKRVLQQLNKPKDGHYAIGGYQGTAFDVNFYGAMFGAPNNWLLDSSGKLVKDFETPQYKEAVGYVRDLVAAGLYHPNSLTNPSIKQGEADFEAGKYAVWVGAWGNTWTEVWRAGLSLKPAVNFLLVPPFAAHDGGKPQHFLGVGFQSATLLKRASPERIKELLRILNYLAAPFGSQEDVLLTYGLKDTDYKLDVNGNPVPTDHGLQDSSYVPWKYMAQHPMVAYQPDIPNFAKTIYDAEQTLVPVGVADPSLGLYSTTSTSKEATADKTMADGLTEIIAGRRPLADFDGLVRDWQDAAGNQVRTEFMQALAGKAS